MSPAVPPLLAGALALLLVCLLAALVGAASDRRRLGEAALIAAAAIFLVADWQFAADGRFALYGLVPLVIGLAATPQLGRGESPSPPASWWWAALVVAVATAVKLVDLAGFPDHLNAYSAETGWWGILTLEGVWPDGFWRGQEYDLVNGGRSPLHLPLTWIAVRVFGGTVSAVRFAEVLASTVLLVVFFGWLRDRLHGLWSVAALATFAFSPWHLAQSRMGTFFSASVALGLALLWAADRVDRAERSGRAASPLTWATFGLLAGLIGYAYAPLKVLYLFFAIVWLRATAAAWRRGESGWWRGPLLSLALAGGVLAVQLGVPPRFEDMFRRDFGPLATDNSVWHKTLHDQVTAETQPLTVVAGNVWRNLAEWWTRTWAENRILAWYPTALTIGVFLAVRMLWRAETWVPACYFLIGVIPPLMIFPVQRRTLVLWPLVYVVGVLAGRELASICAGLIDRRWWRATIRAAFVAFWVIASVHGLKVYARTNSIVGIGSYFGPDYHLDMLAEAERLLPSCRVYFVNATFEDQMVASVHLYEPARRVGEGKHFGFIEFSEGDGEPGVLRDRPLCFLLLSRDEEDSVASLEATMRSLGRWFSGNMLLHRWAPDGSDTVQYLLLMTGAASEGGDGEPAGL